MNCQLAVFELPGRCCRIPCADGAQEPAPRNSERRIILKGGFGRAEIMKWPEDVRDKLGIVSDVFEAPDRFKFAGKMIARLAEAGCHVEAAVPGASIFAVKSVAT